MRRFLSYSASPTVLAFGLLILRFAFAGLFLPHGYEKIMNFDTLSEKFMPFLGLSPKFSLCLDIFAEFFCSIFLMLGLFTRFAAIPPIIAMSVAINTVHNNDIFGKGQGAALFLFAFLVLLFTGAGKFSVDAAIYKHGGRRK